MCFGFQRDNALYFLDFEIVTCALVGRCKLLNDRALGKSYVVFIGRKNLIGVLLGGLFNHVEKRRLLFFAVNYKLTTEYFVATML